MRRLGVLLAVLALIGAGSAGAAGRTFTIVSSEANPPKAKPSSPAALNRPVSASIEPTKLSLPATQPRRDSGNTR